MQPWDRTGEPFKLGSGRQISKNLGFRLKPIVQCESVSLAPLYVQHVGAIPNSLFELRKPDIKFILGQNLRHPKRYSFNHSLDVRRESFSSLVMNRSTYGIAAT